jgi:hypothetical protein
MHAGDEGVAALDAVDEAVVAEKIERAVDRDRCRTPMPGESLDDLVGAERAVGVQQRLEHVAAHRGEPLRAGGAQHFRVRDGRAGATFVVVVRRRKNGLRHRDFPAAKGHARRARESFRLESAALYRFGRNRENVTTRPIFMLRCSKKPPTLSPLSGTVRRETALSIKASREFGRPAC